MQNIETKKIETTDERMLALVNDVKECLQRNEWNKWAYERTKLVLKDDKTLKITREGFTMFDLREIDKVATSHEAMWYIGNSFPSPIDVTVTVYFN